MATNKHATIRYQALDKCFQNTGRKYFINDLVDACNKAIFNFDGNSDGVKKRQVQADISFMQSESGFAIELEKVRENRKVYYRYLDSSFSIKKQPLNPSEESQLREALLTLSRFKGMTQFEWIDELTVKLESGLNLKQANKKNIEFEQNQFLKGLEHISTIFHAIQNEEAIAISYQSFKSKEEQNIDFSPYFLKQFNNRWFLFGRNNQYETISNLALDRIVSISDTKCKYLANNSIDFEEYFEDIIGVSVSNKERVVTIKVQVNAALFPYIDSKPIHGSQKVKEKGKEYSIIELKLIPNYELESLLLSYGENIVVLEPESLREKLRDRLINAANNY
jgi:predicted DNA-binding transcriptional regulator YafY